MRLSAVLVQVFYIFRTGGFAMIKVSPSILSADFVNLERDIRALTPDGADYVHIDVMDGNFVPNISIGIPVVAAIRKITELPLDVHLMIDRPIRYVERFCQAGADILTVHVEADTEENTLEALRKIQACGVRPAICLKPKTPAEAALPYLSLCSLILVMTVEPGFGGQSFMADMMPKVQKLRQYIAAQKPDCELEVDGGVNAQTAKVCTAAGADVLVAGSAFFKAPDKQAFVRALKG
jgi:ribulose-phosphate 3-epimerase